MQFDFFATWHDDWRILQDILLQTGASIIPDKWYETRQPDVYTDIDDQLKGQLRAKRQLFIVPSDEQIYPGLGMIEQKSGERKGWFRVHHVELANSLVMTLPACFEQNETMFLGSGMLVLASGYYNHMNNRWEPPTETLVKFNRVVRKILRQHLTRVVARQSRIWIGSEALKLLKKGAAEILDIGV